MAELFNSLQQIQSPPLPPGEYKLIFFNEPKPEIFTKKNISDIDGNPLKILLVENITNGDQVMLVPVTEHPPLHVELVVVNDCWTTSPLFRDNIVQKRDGRPDLLLGDSITTLEGGSATIKNLKFTDNSSWTRTRKFRIGAIGVWPMGFNVAEAISEAFSVKEYSVWLYGTRYPPMLEDRVWRLENIKKDGPFHRKLTSAGIGTVREFLQESTTNPERLKEILGPRMSDKKWETLLNHARTCNNIDRVPQGIMSTETAPIITQGALMDSQPSFNYVQANEDVPDVDDYLLDSAIWPF